MDFKLFATKVITWFQDIDWFLHAWFTWKSRGGAWALYKIRRSRRANGTFNACDRCGSPLVWSETKSLGMFGTTFIRTTMACSYEKCHMYSGCHLHQVAGPA